MQARNMTRTQLLALLREADALADSIMLAYMEERIRETDASWLGTELRRLGLFLSPDRDEPCLHRSDIKDQKIRDVVDAGIATTKVSEVLGYRGHASVSMRLARIAPQNTPESAPAS